MKIAWSDTSQPGSLDVDLTMFWLYQIVMERLIAQVRLYYARSWSVVLEYSLTPTLETLDLQSKQTVQPWYS